MKVTCILVATVMTTMSALAQVSLVKDIATQPADITDPATSPPPRIVSGNLLYFSRFVDDNVELWRTDGTTDGTFLLDNGRPPFADLNGTLLYVKGNAIAKTTGTASSNEIVKDIAADQGTFYSQIDMLSQLNGKMYFTVTAYYPDYTQDLWSTDGTSDGTVKIAALDIGDAAGTNISNARTAGPYVYFYRYFYYADNSFHNELWRTDGTEAGTISLTELGSDFIPLNNAIIGDNLLFNKPSSTPGLGEIWITDGTTAGTVLVTTISAHEVWFDQDNNNRVFIRTVSGDVAPNSGIFVTDGTEEGTIFLYPSGNYKRAGFMNGTYYVVTDNCMLVTSDGTTNGTTAEPMPNCAESLQGPFAYDPSFTILNDHFFISFVSDDTGHEPGWSDGTPAGTTLIKDIIPGSHPSNSATFIKIPGQNRVVFFANDSHGRELWVTDGTEDGTNLVKDIGTGTASAFEYNDSFSFATMNGELYFKGINNQVDVSGKEAVWKTDGTSEGTSMNYPFDSKATFLGQASNHLIYYDYVNFRLLGLDGIDNSSAIIKTLPPSSNVSTTFQKATVNNRAILQIGTTENGSELWVSDGTADGTHMLKDINPGIQSGIDVSSVSVATLNSKAFFAATDAAHGNELWTTDGTEANTTMVKDINPTEGSFPNNIVATKTQVFFFATDSHGTELWKSDGTAAGTAMIKDAFIGEYFLYDLIAGTDKVYFIASINNELQLWESDGTADGTQQMASYRAAPLPFGGYLDLGVVVGNTLYFGAADDDSGSEVRMTEGLESGITTFDLTPGAGGSAATVFTVVGGFSYFTYDDKLYRSSSIDPEPALVANYGPRGITLFNGYIYFVARSADYGIELFKVPFTKYDQDLTFNPIEDKNITDDYLILGAIATHTMVTYTGNDKVSIQGDAIANLLKPGRASITAHAGDGLYKDIEITREFCIIPEKPYIPEAVIPNFDGTAKLTSSATEGNQWFKDGHLVPRETNQDIFFNESGSYSVQVTIEGCSSEMSDPFPVTITGLETSESHISIYPNPASKELSVEWKGNEAVALEVMNIHGQKIYDTGFHHRHTINLAAWSSDLYILKVTVNGNVIWRKVVKQ